MHHAKLRIVTCYFNPINWESRERLYREFRDHVLDSGAELVVVECALGNRPHVLHDDSPWVHHIPVRAESLAWNKENLINLGIRHIHEDTDNIAWVDADVEHRNRDWVKDTVDALDQYQVIQTWGDSLDLGPKNEPMLVNGVHVQPSFCKFWNETGEIKAYKSGISDAYNYPHPGYSWAARTKTLNKIGGLIEVSGLGAGDHQMAMSFIGNIKGATHGQTSSNYQTAIEVWGARAFEVIKGNVGYIPGTLEHHFHGDKRKRFYQDRWEILIEHQFDPNTDLKKNLYGVLELAGNKPDMGRKFDRYYRVRSEDDNCLATNVKL